jgi:hypothetical protein
VTVSGGNGISASFAVSFMVEHVAQNASAPNPAPAASTFKGVAKDAAGNTYAVGTQNGTDAFTYGPGVSAQGSATGENAVIVKYNSAGVAQWARSVTCESTTTVPVSHFNGVAVSPDGYVYAVGDQTGKGDYDYGSGKKVAGAFYNSGSSYNNNAVIVKYDSAGVTQWARSTTAGNAWSEFKGVTADESGVYAVGYQYGTSTFSYNSSPTVSATATSQGGNNHAVIVKYDSAGAAQWAKTTISGSTHSEFRGVAADPDGLIVYAVGYQSTATPVYYNTGIYVAGANTGGENAVIVKYGNDTGGAWWARSVVSITGTSGSLPASIFHDVAADGSGIYAVGAQQTSRVFNYGGVVTAQGSATSTMNAVIVKYASGGVAEWAQSITNMDEPLALSIFNGVAVDGAGNVYAAGVQTGTGAFSYGPGTSAAEATGGASSNTNGYNSVVVQYDHATGTALWAKVATNGGAVSNFNGVAANSAGSFATVGNQVTDHPFTYGGRVTATGGYNNAYSGNAVVVEYR